MTSLNPTGAPPEAKLVASGTYGGITLVVTWILANYVFHGHIPADLQTLLPGFVAMVAGLAAGWLTRHTPRMDETVMAVRRELARQSRPPQQASQMSLMPGTVQPQPVPPGPTGMAR